MGASGRESVSGGATSSAIIITGKVDVGRFVLEVGGPVGSIVSRVPHGRAAASGELANAVKRKERNGRSKKEGRGGRFEHDVERASEETDAVERATELFKTLAEGRIDPKALTAGIDELLSVTGHFVKAGRMAEAMKLGRAVCGILALAQRWAELLHTLRELLSAGEAAGDAHTAGWACHELGTLHLCGENPPEAGRLLRQAREIRENLGDGPGIAATDHNLRALCRLLQDLVSERRLVQPRQIMRRLLFLALTLAIVLAGGGSAAALLSGGGRDGGSMIAGSSPSTTITSSSLSTTTTASKTSSSTSKATASPPPSGAASVSFTSGAPPDGTVGQPYGPFAFTASGDSGITYSVAGGGVPGLSLSPDGRLSGTPTQPGRFPLTVTAHGASGGHAERATTITINRSVTSPTLTFTSGAPPNGTEREAYGPFAFTASGDSGITYSVAGGGVPGLSLSPDGQLSGTPTQSGTFTLTVTAQSASGSHANQSNVITISPPDHSKPPTGIGSNPPAGTGSNPPAGTGSNPPAGSGSNPPAGSGSNPPAATGSTPPGVVR